MLSILSFTEDVTFFIVRKLPVISSLNSNSACGTSFV